MTKTGQLVAKGGGECEILGNFDAELQTREGKTARERGRTAEARCDAPGGPLGLTYI